MENAIAATKGKRGRRAKEIVVHSLPEDFDKSRYAEYIAKYYDESTRKPLELNRIVERIKKADGTISENIAQTALDIYFVRANWKTLYSKSGDKSEQFTEWLKNTVPLSRSYSLDLLKCVSTIVELKTGHKPKELDDTLIAAVKDQFSKHGVTLLREIAHAPEELQKKLLPRIEKGDQITVDEIRKQKRTALGQKPSTPLQNVIEHQLLEQGSNKVLLSLKNITDPALQARLERAIERAYNGYLSETAKTATTKKRKPKKST